MNKWLILHKIVRWQRKTRYDMTWHDKTATVKHCRNFSDTKIRFFGNKIFVGVNLFFNLKEWWYWNGERRTPYCYWLTDLDPNLISVLFFDRVKIWLQYYEIWRFFQFTLKKNQNPDSIWWSKKLCDKKQLFFQQCPCVH